MNEIRQSILDIKIELDFFGGTRTHLLDFKRKTAEQAWYKFQLLLEQENKR